jgi:hypothetical protein
VCVCVCVCVCVWVPVRVWVCMWYSAYIYVCVCVCIGTEGGRRSFGHLCASSPLTDLLQRFDGMCLLNASVPEVTSALAHSFFCVFAGMLLAQEVRILALDTLSACTSTFIYHQLYPYKEEVILRTRAPLGDHKRLVRQAAARCRNLWIMLQFREQQ